MARRHLTKMLIVDEVDPGRVVWDAFLDGEFFCYVERRSEDFYTLTVELVETGDPVYKHFFTHQGKITPDMIQDWKERSEQAVDNFIEAFDTKRERN